MTHNETDLTGTYIRSLAQRIAVIEKDANWVKARRLLLFLFLVLICFGGIIYGAREQGRLIKAQYEQFIAAPDRSGLDQNMMDQRDMYEFYVGEFLGNDPAQSLMGGYYFTGDGCRIYPDETASRTMISVNGEESALTDYLADNINVRDGRVFYRNPASRALYEFDISSSRTRPLYISHSGQFVVCGEDWYYIELSTGTLLCRNPGSGEPRILADNGITSFAIAGNDVIYLTESQDLIVLDLSSGASTVIGTNVVDFSYDGRIWAQVSDSVFRLTGEDRTVSEVLLGLECNRLLGLTTDGLIFESGDGVYLHDSQTGDNIKLCDDCFLDYCGGSVLHYDVDTDEVFQEYR